MICPQAGIVYRKMSAQCAELSFRLSNFPACSPPVCKRVILNKRSFNDISGPNFYPSKSELGATVNAQALNSIMMSARDS